MEINIHINNSNQCLRNENVFLEMIAEMKCERKDIQSLKIDELMY